MRSCRRSVCFVFSWTAKYPHVLAVRGDPLDGWCTVGPRYINSAGVLTVWFWLAPRQVPRLRLFRAGNYLPLLSSEVGGAIGARISVEHCMGSFSEISYGVESYKLESINVDCVSKCVRFLILSSSDKSRTLSTVSPFAIYKGISGIRGEPKAVRKLKSGDFLIETFPSTQIKSFLLAKTLLDIPISVIPHTSLNSVRGVISETELLTASDSNILEGFASQGVIHAHCIHIKKGTESYPTQHIILTFNKTELPKSVIAGYLHCRIRPYVPNPARCYKCQRFCHSKVACRGKQVCSRFKESKSIQTEKFTQTDASITGLFCSVSKTTVSTLTDDNICRVTRPPKKKKSNQISNIVQSNENTAASSTHFSNSNNMLAQVKPRKQCSFPQSESMLADNSLSDDSDTDNYVDYDPEETIEDIPHDIRTRQPSISQANLNRKSLPTFKMKKHRRRRKS
ncbi:hypothetical protein AVEN_209193-1 [Araneus ventricosus]|uniref:Uncharacterized protein n=1 Tax=Araneus ventricosus TaxID=182803 RepID=A0A4Y2LHC0_ARAVE|nr:hypothetical protein AVEN_209193-1 [Araneus ventricosus]